MSIGVDQIDTGHNREYGSRFQSSRLRYPLKKEIERDVRRDEKENRRKDVTSGWNESKIDEVKARGYLNVDERQEMEKSYWYFEKDDGTEAVEGNGWRLENLERRISYWGDQDFRRSLYLRFSFSLRILFFSSAPFLSIIFRFFFRTIFY